MYKVISRVAILRRGVKEFTEEVNKLCAEGWEVDGITIEPKLLRIVCLAVLVKKE